MKSGFPAYFERAKRTGRKYHFAAFSLSCLGIEKCPTFATVFGYKISLKIFEYMSISVKFIML